MKALPFPCIRPVPEHAADLASRSPRSLQTREDVRRLIEDGALVEDRNLGYYLYELAQGGHTCSGIVSVCSLDEYASEVISAGGPDPDEDAVREELDHLRACGCQTQPVILAHPDQPVLDMIAGAAKTSAALYVLENGAGDRQTVWEVTRREAVDALHAMLAQLPTARICGGHAHLEAAARMAREQREEAQQAGTLTGKEPFNYVLSILIPQSQAEALGRGPHGVTLPLGALFAHRIAK